MEFCKKLTPLTGMDKASVDVFFKGDIWSAVAVQMIHLGQTDHMQISEVKDYESHSQKLPLLVLALLIVHVKNHPLTTASSITTAVTVLKAECIYTKTAR